MCRREIAHYRRLDRAGAVHWVDLRAAPEILARHGISPEAALRRIHGVTTAGEVVTGAEVFVMAWEHLPGWRMAAAASRRLHLVPLMERAYAPFSRWRWRRLADTGCADGQCASDAQPPGPNARA